MADTTRETRSRGEIEADISEAIIRFEREYMGRGPEEAKTYCLHDLIIVRLQGVLTPAEKRLSGADQGAQGRALIKQVRMELIEQARPLLVALIQDIAGRHVRSMHTDISTVTGERIVVFSLDPQ